MTRFFVFLLEKIFEYSAFLGRRVGGRGGSVSETCLSQLLGPAGHLQGGSGSHLGMHYWLCPDVGVMLQTQAISDASEGACSAMGGTHTYGAILKKQALGGGGGWSTGASHTYLRTSIQSSTIHSNQEVEAGKRPSTDEPSVVHTPDGALLSFRKRGDADPGSNVDEAEDIMVSETRQTQKD